MQRKHLLTASLIGAAFAGAAISGARAEDSIFADVLSTIGMLPSSHAAIEYRERAPLVLPPSRDLPPPEAPATTDASWPKDPDVERARRDIEDEKLPATQSWRYIANREDPNRISTEELRGGRVSGRGPATGPSEQERLNPVLSASELNKGRAAAKVDDWSKNGEPKRVRLTDPPPGYRTPAESAAYAADTTIKREKPEDVRRRFIENRASPL
jgi:hypothetical protein